MPVYVYERPDGSRFELRQGFTEDSLTTDPETGVPVRRVLQPAPIIFKGSGWYKTDSRPTSSDTGASSEPKKADGDGGGSDGDKKADAAPTTEKAVSDATTKVSGEVKAASEKPAAAAPAASSTPAPAKTTKSSTPAAS